MARAAIFSIAASFGLAVAVRAHADDSCSASTYTGQRISMDFKDADVVNVLRLLSNVGGENIVITDDVKGRMTLRLVDVPWDQAFDIVVELNRLSCVRLGSVRTVH